MSAAQASVVISTVNRREDVVRAIGSSLEQSVECEVIVVDDGGSDGTAETIERDFPGVRLERRAEQVGSLVRRNEGFRLATAPVVVSLDDDSEFLSPHTVEQTLEAFDRPRIGAVTIPYSDAPHPDLVKQHAPSDGRCHLAPYYYGCAAAVRREAFLSVGGYRELLHHSGEELDMGRRLFGAGWVVRVGWADAAMHRQSARRDSSFAARHATRSSLLVNFFNVPGVSLPGELALALGVAGGRALRRGHPLAVAGGVGSAVSTAWRHRAERAPLDRQLYRVYQRIDRPARRFHYPVVLEEIESELPVLAS